MDGYGYNSATLYHHLNLGWAGTADAWYNLPTISAGSYNFTSVIECIYNIFPEGSGEIISGRVLDAAGNPVNGATITATRTGGGSYSATSNSQGIYALAKIPAASTYTITATKPDYVFFPQTVSTGTSVNGNTAIGNLWGIDFVQDSPGITLNQALDNNYLAFTTGGDSLLVRTNCGELLWRQFGPERGLGRQPICLAADHGGRAGHPVIQLEGFLRSGLVISLKSSWMTCRNQEPSAVR